MPGLGLLSGLKAVTYRIPDDPVPHVHMPLPFQRPELFPALMAIPREGELPHVLY